MLGRRWKPRLLFPAIFLLIQLSIFGAAQKWLTLDGKEPVVIANGGHSLLFPHSSGQAFGDAQARSLSSTLLLCDARLMKDDVGICLPDINMGVGTLISNYYPDDAKTYKINGISMTGWFTIDYFYNDTYTFNLSQANNDRTLQFDGMYFIVTVGDLQQLQIPPRLWINIQHDKFYTDHKLNMTKYLLNTTGTYAVDFVSSPELAFLRNVAPLINSSKTQIIFRFLEKDQLDPSTGQTYGSLLNNLTFIKTFASGILVPKSYIQPVSENLQLEPAISSLVLNAHKAGLKIFTSGFANDFPYAHNYSFNPYDEYLKFVDNSVFSVDGVLTDSPITASGAIGCLAHTNNSAPAPGKPIILTYGGAGGIFPSCTDLAYQQAIEDGTDYIDCPVQVTKDGVLVCLIDIDLFTGTTIAQSSYATSTSLIPAIKPTAGAYTFNFTWAGIQTNLKPQIQTPYPKANATRHPENKNAGVFRTLTEFLSLAEKTPPRSGILISIEHAPFLAENLGLDVTGGVLKALNESNLKQSVIIQSTDSSVLKKIQQQALSTSSYKLMYKIDELVRDVEAPAVKEIASFASFVAVEKSSVYVDRQKFLMNRTTVVEKLKAENLSVFVYLFRNEAFDTWWDTYTDPIAEINTFVFDAGVDGLFTEFPATLDAFRRSRCTGSKNGVAYWAPLKPNNLGLNVTDLNAPIPAAPPLAAGDVAEPPLPSVPIGPSAAPPPGGGPSAGPPASSGWSLLLVAAVVSSLWLV